jgi:hypothetical protein
VDAYFDSQLDKRHARHVDTDELSNLTLQQAMERFSLFL